MRVNQKIIDVSASPTFEAAAKQTLGDVTTLRRLLSCALLGESQFYMNGEDIVVHIQKAVAKLTSDVVMREAIFARNTLGLRHMPLLLICLIAARGADKPENFAQNIIDILRTPKDAMDLFALYFGGQRRSIPHAFKKALRFKFNDWTDYQIAKYATMKNVSVRLRDVMFLTHPRAMSPQRVELFVAVANDTIRAPDTWESNLSVPGANKKEVWERLLSERKLGALALVRNLRNMESVGVDTGLVRSALAAVRASDVWPWQALAAAQQAPGYAHDLSDLMVRSAMEAPRIPGRTNVLVDVSGSMDRAMSARGTMTRMDAAAGLAAVLREICDAPNIGAFSNDTIFLKELPRGVSLAHAVVNSMRHGGTDLRRAVSASSRFEADRLIVITDEQSQTHVDAPGIPTYVINVASTTRGLNWGQNITRIDGWSGGVLNWLAREITGESYANQNEEDDSDD